jgi:D-serine deaminase-like pyridoxal phosphate-dependent protein
MTDLIGVHKHALETPALLVDLDIFEANMAQLAGYCRQHNTSWRPHSKAHKSPRVAHLQRQAGAIGLTCAKLSEAEVMVDHSLDHILIANQIVSPSKLKRLATLQHRAEVMVTLDDATMVAPTAQAAQAAKAVQPVLIEIDIGMNRVGALPGEPVLMLARAIQESPHLSLKGLMGYEGHVLDITPPEAKKDACHKALAMLIECRDLLESNHISVEIVSAGGTGCYTLTAAYPGITEIQAGGGIFMDAMYRDLCNVDDLNPALTVLTSVTSRHAGHVVTDAGFKTLSSYHQPPQVINREDLTFRYLSAEHGIFDIKKGCAGPKLGELIELLVGYSDSTTVLHNQFIGVRNDHVEAVWDISARGKLQ